MSVYHMYASAHHGVQKRASGSLELTLHRAAGCPVSAGKHRLSGNAADVPNH